MKNKLRLNKEIVELIDMAAVFGGVNTDTCTGTRDDNCKLTGPTECYDCDDEDRPSYSQDYYCN